MLSHRFYIPHCREHPKTTIVANMRAARYYGKEDIRIENDVKKAECGEGQITIEPAFVGICGTDLHEFLGGPK